MDRLIKSNNSCNISPRCEGWRGGECLSGCTCSIFFYLSVVAAQLKLREYDNLWKNLSSSRLARTKLDVLMRMTTPIVQFSYLNASDTFTYQPSHHVPDPAEARRSSKAKEQAYLKKAKKMMYDV